jgi:hypothetical protein
MKQEKKCLMCNEILKNMGDIRKNGIGKLVATFFKCENCKHRFLEMHEKPKEDMLVTLAPRLLE